jgi:hypothetical protein
MLRPYVEYRRMTGLCNFVHRNASKNYVWADRLARRHARRIVLWQNRKFIKLDLWHTVQHWKKNTLQDHPRWPRDLPQATL